MLVAPDRRPADERAVDDLLGAVEALAPRRRVPARSGDVAARGLDAPTLVVVVGFIGGRQVEVRVGRRDEALGRVWVASSERPQEAFLVDEYQVKALDRTADDLRRRAPFTGAAAATRLVVEQPGARLVLAGEPGCVELRGGCARADATRVAALRDRLAELRVTRFVDGSPRVPDGAPRLAADGETLAVIGPCPGAPGERLTWSPLGAACLRDEALRDVFGAASEPAAWVERALVPVPTLALRRIEIGAPGAGLVLERAPGGAWSGQLTGRPLGVDDRAVQDWLTELAAYRAVAVTPTAAPPPAAAARSNRRLVLAWEGGTMEARLEDAPGRVLRSGEPVTLSFHPSAARFFEPDSLAFRDRRVLAFDGYALAAVERRSAGGVETARRGESADDWTVLAPAEVPADEAAIVALREATSTLRAERYLGPRATRSDGLDPPRARLTLIVDVAAGSPQGTPPARHVLDLGASGPDGECRARLDGGDGAVFIIDGNICRVLEAPLATRRVVDLDPATVTAVSLDGLRLERQGDAWLDADGEPLSSRRADALVRLLEEVGEAPSVAGYGALAAPHRRVTIDAGGRPPVTLFFARGEYARADRPVRYRVPSAVCADWPSLCR